MALSSLSIMGNSIRLNPPTVVTASPIATNWSLACSWLGSNVKGTLAGVITAGKMTVTGQTSTNASFNGNYVYGGLMLNDAATPAITSDYSGLFDGSDAIKYTIYASSTNYYARIDLPLPFTMKKLYHNCPTTSTSIGVVFKGSNDYGNTWTTVATHTMTHLNRDTANVPTILSTGQFTSFMWEFTNNLATNAQLWVIDFVGDFYAPTITKTTILRPYFYYNFESTADQVLGSANSALTGYGVWQMNKPRNGILSLFSDGALSTTRYAKVTKGDWSFATFYGYTISFWLFLSSSFGNYQYKAFECGISNNLSLSLRADTVTMGNHIAKISDQGTGVNISPNIWVHFVLTVTGTADAGGADQCKLYVNSVLSDSFTGTSVYNANPWTIYLGRGGTNTVWRSLPGYMDDFRLYNVVVNQTEVNALYNGTVQYY